MAELASHGQAQGRIQNHNIATPFPVCRISREASQKDENKLYLRLLSRKDNAIYGHRWEMSNPRKDKSKMKPDLQDSENSPVARTHAARRSWRLRALKGAAAATVLSAAVGGFLFSNNTAAQGAAPLPVAAAAAAAVPHQLNDASPFSFAD